MSEENYILGIYFGHNASVALARNGKLIFALAEERVRRIKNYTGFPSKAYEVLLKECLDNDPEKIDLVVFPTDTNSEYNFFIHNNSFPAGKYFDYYYKEETAFIPSFFEKNDKKYYAKYIKKDLKINNEINESIKLKSEANIFYYNMLRIDPSKYNFINHHMAHAYSACFNLPNNEQYLIFTLDASGDNLCATVNIFQNGELTVISKNLKYSSLGTFYREITAFLGMKPDEHEFKVMGLAPYAKSYDINRIYKKFEPIIWINDDLEFESAFPMEFTKYFLLKNCIYDRFDSIAGAAQLLLENRVLEWINKWIQKTGINKIAVAGGVFMNVKLNQKVSELPNVEDVFVVPSAGDESTAIGCCYYGVIKPNYLNNIEKINDLYFGVEYTNNYINDMLEKMECDKKYEIQKISESEFKIAELLSNGEIVGRFAGREEWGARALGNRSLLSDPHDKDAIRVMNEIIKNRDFWMPFTPSILSEDIDKYIENPKGIFCPYMSMTFNTTWLGRKHFAAAIHPYDFTIRPQNVIEKWNPKYYKLIKHFKELTGIGGVLNTSLNLHGSPNVHSPEDGIKLLENSGLKYLALENWLVSKRT